MKTKTKETVSILVIGGGAAGMMAAGRAAERGLSVVLLEKNKALGDKLRISGLGRCNIANADLDAKKLSDYYGDAAKFLHSPFSLFGVKEAFNFFESRGLPLVVEEKGRAFPKSQKAEDVCIFFEQYLRDGKVEVRKNTEVEGLVVRDGKVAEVETKTHIYVPETVILATGGISRPETGSTGDGFGWLREAGHTVKEPTPDLVPLKVAQRWVKDIKGVSLDDIKITFYVEGVKQFQKRGRMLCTHFGISGPMIINLASKVSDLLHGGTVTAKIDLFPASDVGTLEKQFVALFDENKNKMLKNVLPEILLAGFMPAFERVFTAIDLDTKVHSVTKEQRKEIVQTLKSLEITITSLMGLDRAVVADGGVALNELEMKTMRSKVCENLYIVGDLLHINRPTGGYSFQLCWTTGYLAGSSVTENK